jgi:ribosomal-protein-alanine N-acetyltransferase
MTTKTQFSIRNMDISDLPEVMKIDSLSFPAPWTKEVYEQELLKNDFAHYFVIVHENEIAGYVGIWIVFDDAQITNIAVAPHYRGKGIGEKLFGFALTYSFQLGAQKLSLEVRPSNYVAKNMYKKFGLKEGGIRKNYYPDNGEDAIVMWVNLTEINFANFID